MTMRITGFVRIEYPDIIDSWVTVTKHIKKLFTGLFQQIKAPYDR